MADNYDGSVIIKTGLDLATIEKDAEALKKAIEAATKGAKELMDVAKQSGAAQIAMLKQANAGWSEQLRILQQIRDVMGGEAVVLPSARRTSTPKATPTEQTQVESAEYAELRKQAEALDKQLDKTVEKIDKMVALYGQANVEGMRAFQSLQYDLTTQQEKYDRIVDRMRELEMDGKKFAAAPTPAIQEQAKSVEQLTTRYTKLATVTKKAQTEAVKTTKAVAHHGGISFKNILKYAFGIRSMFFLMRRLRAVAKESLKVMAQHDPTLNAVLSKFMTAVKQLKADFGTMLQPLVQAGAPIFTWLLDKVSAVTVELARFFAALSGQDYINRATVQAVDLADSLDNVADSAEKALGGYDKLNVISDNTKDTKSTMALTKDTVKYTKEALNNNSWTVKLGRRLREIFTWVGAKLKKLKDWLEKQPWVQNLIDKFKEILSDPDKLIITLGAVGLGVILGKRLVSKMLVGMSGLTNGILGLIPKAAVIAVTAVIGYKVGNKIFDLLPEDTKDWLGQKTFNLLFQLGFVDENGNPDNPWEVIKNQFKYGRRTINDDGDYIDSDGNIVYVRKAKVVTEVVQMSPEEKAALAFQAKVRWMQAKLELSRWWESFKASVAPIVMEFNAKFEAKYGVTPTAAFNAVKDKFMAAWNNPLNPIKTGVTIIKTGFASLWESLFKPTANIFTDKLNFVDNFVNKWNAIKSAWEAKTNPIKTGTTGMHTDFVTWWGNVFKTGTGLSIAETAAMQLSFQKIKDEIKKLWESKTNPIKEYLADVKKGFSSLWENLFNTDKQEPPKVTVTAKQKQNITEQGRVLGVSVIDGFRGAIEDDKSISKTIVEKVTSSLATGYNTATTGAAVINAAIASGKLTPASAAKQMTTTTTKNGDIVLTLDGKVVAKSVWDNTAKQYKQTGVSLLV